MYMSATKQYVRTMVGPIGLSRSTPETTPTNIHMNPTAHVIVIGRVVFSPIKAGIIRLAKTIYTPMALTEDVMVRAKSK